jgi:predicted lysophospholipase L1 biosynthesis ABC-type transport system permease subunit
VRGANAVAAWLCWWVACYWLWLLFVGTWDRIDGVAGAVVAVVAATLAERGRRAARIHPRVAVERLARSATVPLIVFADFGVVTYALVASIARRRVVRGRYLARDFAAGPKTTPEGAAHRAWTVLLAGYSPNAYVVDIEPEENVVLIHDLVPWRRSEEPA